MDKKAAKAKMQTCAAQMRINAHADRQPAWPVGATLVAGQSTAVRCVRSAQRSQGFVLAEMVMVMFIIGLLVSIAMVNMGSVLGRNTFKAQANGLVSVLQMAAAKAAESSRRYEIIIDFPTQSYTLREITSDDLGVEPLQEEIIRQYAFSKGVQIKYVQFDDGMTAAEGQAKFRAGHAGWQYGGKVVLVDENGNDYTIMVNRLGKTVELLNGDIWQLEPLDDLAF
jgi:prepilin-type N-terminal cleavage/methylation domain-containing protein